VNAVAPEPMKDFKFQPNTFSPKTPMSRWHWWHHVSPSAYYPN